MEAPPRSTLASSYRKLPLEAQFRILLQLPVNKLLEMCRDNSEGICDDYPFWKEKLEVDGLTYTIVPERDFYRGIPTILNSEEAALV